MATEGLIELEQEALWRQFALVSTDSQRVLVRSLVQHACPLLNRIVDTFPTYTLHNERHALNVVKLMGDLVGPSIGELSSLECAILILSAYYHDIGMLYSRDELGTLDKQPWFTQFIKSHPEAYIRFYQDGSTVSDYLAEWYCRWRHAERVFTYLNDIPDDQLLWGVVSIRHALGQVCQSHNLEAKALLDEGVFVTDFLGVCDLRMCAILLRLADLLDFDRTRSPKPVFGYLKLDTGTSESLRQSRLEWSKHLASDGFLFPANRSGNYPITLIAAPDNPSVEHDVREFIDTVEQELKECLNIRRSCSPRWRDLPLPEAVNRTQIQSRGYRYGNYRFELDRRQVLRLFMGENLYQSSYAFIRELIQNSIDTTRHREYHEKASGTPDYVAQPIQVRDWRDKEGRRWIRIDDFGMGMDEAIIERYFLAVGNSYYQSAEFRAAMLSYEKTRKVDFQPISRFGIGLLSCFLMADLVEVSTRHVSNEAGVTPAIRLSLNGMDAYYTLQAEPLGAKPMPAPGGQENGYRNDIGTSIALRIDAEKEELFDLPRLVERYVIAPPVGITVNGKPAGGSAVELYDKPWYDAPFYVPLLPFGQAADGEALTTDPGGPALKVIPLDLTAVSPDHRFRGQMMLVCLRGYRSAGKTYSYNVRLWNGLIDVPMDVLHPDPRPRDERGQYALNRITIDISPWTRSRDRVLDNVPDALSISHNGIRVPMSVTMKGEEDGQPIEANVPLSAACFFGENDKWAIAADGRDGSRILTASQAEPASGTVGDVWREFLSRHEQPESSYPRHSLFSMSWVLALRTGALELKDDLKPTFSASRDVVSGWQWNVMSIVHLAYGRALIKCPDELAYIITALDMSLFGEDYGMGIIEDYTMSTVMADPLMSMDGGWRALPFIPIYDDPPYPDNPTGARPIAPIGDEQYFPVNAQALRPTLVSLDDLLLRIKKMGEVKERRFWVRVLALEASKGPGFVLMQTSFFHLVSAALLQGSVRLGFDPSVPQPTNSMDHTGMITYEVLGIRDEGFAEELQAYPAVAFVEYADEKLLRAGKAGLNVNHPLSRWLIGATGALRKSKRGVFTSLWQEITKEDDQLIGGRLDEMIDSVNSLLDSLRYEGFVAAPPHGLVLRRSDFSIKTMGIYPDN